MAFSHGSKANFQVQDSGGTLRDLSAYLTSAGLDRQADTAETSVLGLTSKTFIPGLLDGTIPIAGEYDPTVDGYLAGILGNATPKNFQYGPQGTTSGLAKYTGTVILVRYAVQTDVSAEAKITGEFHITGNVTLATFP